MKRTLYPICCYFVALLTVITLLRIEIACSTEGDSLWSRQYGGRGAEIAYAARQTDDGGYLMAGLSASYGGSNEDAWLLKTNAEGDSLWAHTFGGFFYDAAYALIPVANGWLLVGYTGSFGDWSGDVLVVKTDSLGNQLWMRYFGGKGIEWANAVVQTADGGFLLFGGTTSTGAGADLLILKITAHGDSLWARTYGGGGDEWATSAVAAGDGGYLISGMTTSFGSGGEDFWLLKVDANGDSLWSKTYGGSGNDYATILIPSNDGYYLQAGSTYSFGSGQSDMWLLKTDQNGDSLWLHTYGGSGWESASAVVETENGIYLAGYSDSFGSGGGDFWLVKTTPGGDSLWARSYGGVTREAANACILNAAGNLLLAGDTWTQNGNQDNLWLLAVEGEPPSTTPELQNIFPQQITFSPVFPNPCNAEAKITLSLPYTAQVDLKLIDICGREINCPVTNLAQGGLYIEGNHNFYLKATAIPSGVYIVKCTIQPQPFSLSGRLTLERKLVLVK